MIARRAHCGTVQNRVIHTMTGGRTGYKFYTSNGRKIYDKDFKISNKKN